MLKLVPFNDHWITHDKLDLHAIYRRPRFKEDEYGELVRELDGNGQPTWDLTTPLPVKQHNKLRAKGFEYVTLANRESLVDAAKAGTIDNWQQYVQDPRTRGPWHYRKYVENQTADLQAATDARVEKLARLAKLVESYGYEAVEDMQRELDQTFVMPDSLRPKAAKKERVQ